MPPKRKSGDGRERRSKNYHDRPSKPRITEQPRDPGADDDFQTPLKDLGKSKKGVDNTNKGVQEKTAHKEKDKKRKKQNKEVSESESDDDFVKPAKKLKLKVGKEKAARTFVEYRDTKLKLRCSPGEFVRGMKDFTNEQKEAVRSMGFGSVLEIDIDSIQTGLGFWLLSNYDETTRTVNVGNWKIKITSSLVHECFGIPVGTIPVLEHGRPKKGSGSTIDEFKSQFNTSTPTGGQVLNVVKTLLNGGRMFKINFLVLWNTVFGEITKSTKVNQKFLISVDKEDDIPNMKWCSYLLECLNSTKAGWKQDQYNGPIAMLTVIYTHEYNKRHNPTLVKNPAISYITSSSLHDMESYIYDNGPLTDIEEDGDDNVVGNEESEKISSEKGVSETVKDAVDVLVGMHEKEPAVDEEELDYDNLDWRDFDMGTQTQQMFEYCATPIQLSGVECDKEEFDAAMKAKKVWMKKMDRNMKKYLDIQEEMDDMVSQAREKYFWSRELIDRCQRWDGIRGKSSKEDDVVKQKEADEHVVGLGEDQGFENSGAQLGGDYDMVVEEAQAAGTVPTVTKKTLVGYKRFGHGRKKTAGDQGGDKEKVTEQIVNIEDNTLVGPDETVAEQIVNIEDNTVVGHDENVVEGSTKVVEDNVDKGIVIEEVFDDDGISDTALAMLQTIEPGVYGIKDASIGDEQQKQVEEQVNLAEVIPNVPFVQVEQEKDPETPKDQMIREKKGKTKVDDVDGGRPVRKKNPSWALRSPYIGRKVSLFEPLTKDEQMMAEYMMAPTKKKMKVVYKSDAGTSIYKAVLESFYPGIWLHTNAVDAYIELLNYEEKKTHEDGVYKLYCSTTMMPADYYEAGISEHDRVKVFKSNLQHIMKTFDIKSLDDFNIIIVPLLIKGHFYLMCFDIKDGYIELIDNSKNEPDFQARYGGVPEVLRHTFYLTLRTLCERSIGIERIEGGTIHRREMPWRTEKNIDDCGIFAIRHMETYKGNKVWKAGFVDESELQNKQLNSLRIKYVAKLILSEHNRARDDAIEEAHKFSKRPYKDNMI